MDFITSLGHNIQNNWLSLTLLLTAITFNIILLTTKLKNNNPKTKKQQQQTHTITNLTHYIIEAEKILGQGQGNAKLNYVLNKIGSNTNDKKTIKLVENILTALKTAKNIITSEPTITKGKEEKIQWEATTEKAK